MSGFGKAIPRAWRRGGLRTVTATRDVEIDMDLEAARFRRLAPVLGFCGACGAVVDEARGKLHGWDCPHLPPERRCAPPAGKEDT